MEQPTVKAMNPDCCMLYLLRNNISHEHEKFSMPNISTYQDLRQFIHNQDNREMLRDIQPI